MLVLYLLKHNWHEKLIYRFWIHVSKQNNHYYISILKIYTGAAFEQSKASVHQVTHEFWVLPKNRRCNLEFLLSLRKKGVESAKLLQPLKAKKNIKVHCEKEDSGGVRLIYEDDGVGVSAKNKAKLFTEGFSTGGSTGFGLFLIKKMMDAYGWNITEEGELGKGAKFTITIPHRPSAPQPRKPT